jgi:putative peptide zinc metalloprotease protein
MRTDLYFVLADLTRCRALYADGAAYVGYLARRCWWPVTRRSPPSDPSATLPPAERTAVRAYAIILAAGTTVCLAFAAAVTLPTAGVLISRAARDLLGTAHVTQRLDAAATLALLTVFWTLWCGTWWRRHGPRITAWSRSWTRQPQHERG